MITIYKYVLRFFLNVSSAVCFDVRCQPVACSGGARGVRLLQTAPGDSDTDTLTGGDCHPP